ncbi:hypothetical protein V2J09_020366 [Rumex salicifolius]
MDCLVAPVSALKRRCSGRYGYRQLVEDEEMAGFGSPEEDPVTVVVGKEKRQFRVDPFVLRESPFRALIDLVNGNKESGSGRGGGDMVFLVDLDSILFEHLLWLMSNDCSSLFKLNLKEILDFYALDN